VSTDTSVRFEDAPDWRARMEALGAGGPMSLNIEATQRAYVRGQEFHVLTSRDEIAPGDTRWHLSISGEHKVPPWDVMVAIAHAARPGVCFVIGVPPKSWWMNVHPNVLHLWELRDHSLAAQWKAESMGHEPS
jgi:hypothetical protein